MIFEISTTAKRQTIDVTARVREAVCASDVRNGLCHVMVLHATAAIVVVVVLRRRACSSSAGTSQPVESYEELYWRLRFWSHLD